MSLLDRNPHTVVVQPRQKEKTPRGTYEMTDVGEPSTIRCAVQPVREWSTAEEIQVGGIQMLVLQRIISRKWVGDTNALVDWDGFKWEIVGDPQFFNMSPSTAHWEITIRRVGTKEQ